MLITYVTIGILVSLPAAYLGSATMGRLGRPGKGSGSKSPIIIHINIYPMPQLNIFNGTISGGNFANHMTVQQSSSAAHCAASQPEDVPYEEVSHEEPPVSSQPVQTQPQPEPLTPIDRIMHGIQAVVASGIIQNDYEYAAVVKYIQDLKVIGSLGVSDLIRIFQDEGYFDSQTCPTRSNIARVTITGKYPNWVVREKGMSVTSQLFNVAKVFKAGYELE